MSLFKCKMCGGTVEFENGATVGVCDSCGTKQTLPRLDDDRKANLYDRANHFRRNNEYDKAMSIYEQILNEDSTDAESYWSIVLCKYGIEYVEDPTTHNRVPTVNRVQFTSVVADEDYKKAIEYADISQKIIYEEEAAAIDRIQKGILEISEKEEPFDVFICYKETDNNGRRTQDSVFANDMYHQLVQEGFKVFFSRITLEDKLGSAYEPYIFAALNSAKVMIVLGTKPEFFNAVWVKNEWSRYLALIKKGEKKVLIPAYKDMDPYDLPEEFSHLQAQDMTKLGFMQDLIRGIKKIVNVDGPIVIDRDVSTVGMGANVNSLLKRVSIFLEDENWIEADKYSEKVLDLEPENAQAYLGKLLAELKVSRQNDLSLSKHTFENSINYQKAVRFGEDEFSSSLRYDCAVCAMNAAETEKTYKNAMELFSQIPNYRDADELARQCSDKAEASRKNAIYESARAKVVSNKSEKIDDYECAIKLYSEILGWKDADKQIEACKNRIAGIKVREEEKKRLEERLLEQTRIAERKAKNKRKILIAIVAVALLLCVGFAIVKNTVIVPTQKLNNAQEMIDSGEYVEAYNILYGLNYKNSEELLESIMPQYNHELLIESLSNATEGSYVYFGSYEQDNNSSNGQESIEWLVLAKDGNRLLLVSKYILDCQPYNTSLTGVTWETCSLREWLNDSFINTAFTEDEQSLIPSVSVSVSVSAGSDTGYQNSTRPGNNVTDRVFILSAPEAMQYFNRDSERMCQGTEYSLAHGVNTSLFEDDGYGWWWVRTPGCYSDHQMHVGWDGEITGYYGIYVDCDECGVRPVLWVEYDA